MPDIPGTEKPELRELPRIRERLSFLYLEHCTINRSEGAITSTDTNGTVHIPAAAVGAILLGPGTSITHRAMELLGDAGASILWVGERGIRYYAHGRPLTHSSKLLMAQAKAVSNTRSRLDVAKRMYQLRFPGEDVTSSTMQQLRGREGARVRSIYRHCSKETGVPWDGRDYDPDDFSNSDPVNAALSAANACLYGIAHCVIVALGCSPGLGFIHFGHDRSFVYDIADLYKAEISIPIAFKVAKLQPDDIGSATRIAVRDAVYSGDIMERAVRDIRYVLMGSMDDEPDDESEKGSLDLWDDKIGKVKSSVSYGNYDFGER